jgi:hypothetical protein
VQGPLAEVAAPGDAVGEGELDEELLTVAGLRVPLELPQVSLDRLARGTVKRTVGAKRVFQSRWPSTPDLPRAASATAREIRSRSSRVFREITRL